MLLTLQIQGCDIWIYTMSYRDVKYIRWIFFVMGIKLAGVVNQAIYEQRIVKSYGKRMMPSKSPSLFGIDILVDAESELNKEAMVYGFDLLWIDPADEA